MLLLKFGDQPCWNDPWYQMLVTKILTGCVHFVHVLSTAANNSR